jgi:hypothetical protein
MQNLGIFGTMESIYFEITYLNRFWKIWINIKPVGPACQSLCPNDGAQTARPASGPWCHHHFLHTVSAAVPPTSTASRGYKRCTPCRGFPLSASSAFAPPCSLCPPHSTTAFVHRQVPPPIYLILHWAGLKGLGNSPSWSNHLQPEPPISDASEWVQSAAVVFLVELTINRHPPSSSSPSKNTVSSLFVPCCSPTHGSTSAVSCLRRWRPPLCLRLPHCR